MKLLVTGRDGQVARALAMLANDAIEVVCVGRPELNLLNGDSVAQAIECHRPDVVVNPAAYTAVDKAESDVDAAYSVNRDGAGYVAAAAGAAGLSVIQISTDYVFRGDKSGPYLETDLTQPQGVYGASKLAGEAAVAAANPDHVILRTSWVYAPWGNNFARTMLRLAKDRDTIRVVADQHGAPTYAPDIAQGILVVAQALLDSPDKSELRGIFHMTSAGETTWAGFAEEIFAASRNSGGDWANVEPIATSEYPTTAKRPMNSVLSNSRYINAFARTLPSWRSGVQRFMSTI